MTPGQTLSPTDAFAAMAFPSQGAAPAAEGRSNPFVVLGSGGAAHRRTPRFTDEDLIPKIPLQDGEQYRFHFDMSRCVGCKCCEVACSEQNNNPPEISWRRVGEVEGGTYPNTQRLHMSMGCNHCLEPSCMTGCPVDAYAKDPKTGLVLHNADTCIGCEYCIWNCPYGVPVFNEERGVVGKCDMCHGRILEGDAPACVEACPEQAIQVEIVNIEEWRREYRDAANAPGLPPADHTISTTRVTLPEDLPSELEKADYHRVRPEKPHHSLAAMTVMTQLSAGAVALVWLLGWFTALDRLNLAATGALLVGLASFLASPLHLGRPLFAYRAMRAWKRSWLSREVLLLTSFGLAASCYAAVLWTGTPAAGAAGALATGLGLAGVFASSRIYLVPARPAWNSPYTIAEFFLTAFILGPLFLSALGLGGMALPAAAAAAACLQLLNQGLKFFSLTRSEEFELRASARLLSSDLSKRYLLRLALLVTGGIVMPLLAAPAAGLALALAGELLGRHLFFVSVVPKNMAMSFFEGASSHPEAA